MAKSLVFASILVLSTATVLTCCHGYYSDSKLHFPAPKKVNHLHFFLHDILAGESPSSVVVARPNITILPHGSVVPFGSVLATDDMLTLGPEITSEVIGSAQGLMVMASQDVLSLVVYWDIGFTRGKFNGSSFTVFSRNSIMETQRELAVARGRGKFRMAEGFALLKTCNFSADRNAVVEYNITLYHH